MRANNAQRCLAVAAVAVGTLVCCSAAPAAVRYAAPGGGGPEPCVEAAPCSLPAAVNGHAPTDVGDGDAVVVGPGTYHPGTSPDIEHAMVVGGRRCRRSQARPRLRCS